MPDTVDVRPTKRFFIENLTRDLTLEDAILDLVDNSIDAAIETYNIDVSPAILFENSDAKKKVPKPLVEIEISEESISVVERAGGIKPDRAKKYVFRLGRIPTPQESTLGVYGIGLKRAVFKMGKDVIIDSKHLNGGFRVNIDLKTWIEDDNDWTLPFNPQPAAKNIENAGTSIIVKDLRPEIQMRIRDPKLHQNLKKAIASTYSLFIDRFVSIKLNGIEVDPWHIPIGGSEKAEPGRKELHLDDVEVQLLTGLAARINEEWQMERAGWYVLCNGRVVVFADKTELTGWGNPGPNFVSKYRGFIGIAFFFAKDPSKLPWTTTKRGLNKDSEAYQIARREMTALARPVLTFLNNMYPGEVAEDLEEREVAQSLKETEIKDITKSPEKNFKAKVEKPKKKKATINVQYRADKEDIKRIKDHLSKPRWSASKVGRYTFDWFIKRELADE